MPTKAKSWFSKFSEPEPDLSGLRRRLVEEIESAANAGDAFIIDKDYLPRYENLGGKKEDLSNILKIAYQRAYENDMELAKSLVKSSNLMCLKLVAGYLAQYAKKIGMDDSEIEQVVSTLPAQHLAIYKSMNI